MEPLDSNAEIMAEYERQLKETRELVDAAKQEGEFQAGVPTEWIVQSFVYLLYAAWDSVSAGSTTADQASDLAWQTLTQGLGTQQ